jgi:hypothetical protein
MKIYLSPEPRKASACKLRQHELGLIGQVKREMIRNYEQKLGGALLDRVDSCMYIGCCFDLTEDFSSEDIVEVDISAAYQTAAKNLGLLSEKTYNRFFEIETDKASIRRKEKNASRFEDYSYFSNGQVLRYSKKCRLISSGSLATKKTIHEYKGYDLVEERFEFDRERANLFYASGYEVSKTMYETAKSIDGVYFWWVDAIFCKASVFEQVKEHIESKGFQVKSKKLVCIEYESRYKRAHIVKEDTGEVQPYFFSNGVSIDHHSNLLEAENLAMELINFYAEFQQLESTDKAMAEKVRSKLEEGEDYRLEKLLFSEICKSLNIQSPKDMGLRYIQRLCRERGIAYKDFIRVKSITLDLIRSVDLDHIFGEEEIADLATIEIIEQVFDSNEDYKSDISITEVQHEKLGKAEKYTETLTYLDTVEVNPSIIALKHQKIGKNTKIVKK